MVSHRRGMLGLGAVLYACLVFVAQADSIRPPTVALDISAQSLGAALNAFAAQSGLQVVFFTEIGEGMTAPRLTGSFTPEAALHQLLAHTSLRYEFVDARTVAIRMAPVSGGAQTSAQERSVQLAEASGIADGPRPIRLAEQSAGGEQQNSDNNSQENADNVKGVIVTGTHIQGSTNPTAPVIVIDRADIERSGYTTTQQLVDSIPQNFRGGVMGASADGALGTGFYALSNLTYATGIDLRGLGAGSTLVLIDGQRVAPSAKGTFVDVSMIPLAAIDHVEIMTDGASAIYGTDAVAGVVNFILRKDYQGQETVANYGSGTDGTRSQEVIAQSFGQNWSGGNAIASLQYQKQNALSSADRSYTAAAPQPTDLFPKSEQYSALLHIRQQLPSGFDIASGILYSHERQSDYQTTTHFEQYSAPLTDSGVANISVGYRPTERWHIQATGAYSLQHTVAPLEFIPSTLNASEGCDPNLGCIIHDNYRQESVELIADGTLFHAPGGDAKAAFGTSYLKESFTEIVAAGPTDANGLYDRHISAEFVELELPIVGSDNAQPLIRQFDLSLAVRHDDYSDFGGTTNPRYGIAWKPLDVLRIRGAYNTSFRAPDSLQGLINTLGDGSPIIYSTQFPSPAGGTVPVLYWLEGGPRLKPEKSRNVTVGFDFVPTSSPLSKISVDYFDIRYKDRIETPGFDGAALSEPNIYGSLITPIASDAAAATFISSFVSSGGAFYDLGGGSGPGVRYLLNGYLLNAALVRTRGADLTTNYHFSIQSNEFNAGLNVAYLRDLLTSYTAITSATDVANTYGNPLHWRGRGQLGWSRGPWSVNTAVNASGSYVDNSPLPFAAVSSWITVDAQLAYKPPFAKNTSLTLSGTNILNRDPPYVIGNGQYHYNAIHYDVGNANPLGRVVVLGVRVAW